MQVLYRSAIFIALSLAPGIVFAGDRLPSQELIEKSELYEQLKSMTASMQSALETLRQQGMAIDDKFEKAWSDAASSAYDAKKLFTPIQQGLKKLLTQDDQKRLLAFYNSPVGERIRKLSVKSLQPGMDTKSEAYARQILADPSKHANRLALYQKIDEAIGGTTFGTELAMNVGVATAIGMESTLEGPKDVDTRAIRAAMERDRFAIAQGMASALLAANAYVYRDLTIEDLHAYLKFLNSPAAKKCNVGVLKLLSEVLILQSEEFGKQFTRNLGRKGV